MLRRYPAQSSYLSGKEVGAASDGEREKYIFPSPIASLFYSFYLPVLSLKQIAFFSRIISGVTVAFWMTPHPENYRFPSSQSLKRRYIRGDGRNKVTGSPLRIADRHTHWMSPAKAKVSRLRDAPSLPKYLAISGFGLRLSIYASTCLSLKLFVARAFDAIQQRKPLLSTKSSCCAWVFLIGQFAGELIPAGCDTVTAVLWTSPHDIIRFGFSLKKEPSQATAKLYCLFRF